MNCNFAKKRPYRKGNDNNTNDTHPLSPRPKKARQVRSNQKAMLIDFLIMKELFIMNLLQLAKPLINISIWMFWNNWEMLLEENIQPSGRQTHGSYNMTMHLLTLQCLYDSFWPKITQQSLTIHHTHLI